AEFEETVKLVLSNPTGFPANIPLEGRLDTNRTTANLTIIDNDFAAGRVSFENVTYTVNENEPLATVTVKRTGGSLGELLVNYDTSDGSAKAGTNYTVVSGTLRWVDNDTAIKRFTVPIIDNKNVDPDKNVNLTLSNPSIPNALGFQATATLRIINDDTYGRLAFSQEDYFVDENGGFATISVIRQGGIAGSVSVNYVATNLTALAGTDFVAASGILNFAPGETSKSFIVPIINDSIVEGDKIISLTLSNAVLGALSTPSVSRLTIIDDELSRVPAGSLDTTFNKAEGTDELIYSAALQQDGNLLIGGDFRTVNDVLRNRMARLNADGSLDTSFDPALGPNNSIRTMLIEPEGRILIGGLFTTVNGTNRNYIARLNFDGNIDPTFSPGGGADNPIYALARQADGRILIGGDFTAFNGVPRNFIARLKPNGVLDATFSAGTGANGTIYAIAVQSDGKILIGGDFTMFNGLPRRSIVRVNQDGSPDTGFDSGVGPNGSVRAIAVQSDGEILIGGLFTAIDGALRNRVGRLNADGRLDLGFNVGVGLGSGANGPVSTIAVQIDGKILLGGDFTLVNGVTRNRITRLNTDGTVDPTINFGTGANAAVSSIVLQPDRKIILVGGFTEYDSVPRKHIARIHGGSISGAGSIAFQNPVYTANEVGTNAVITLRRSGGTLGEVTIDYATQEIDATPGIDFTNVVGRITFREGETFGSFSIPLGDDREVEGEERVKLILSNPTGGAALGGQPNATLIIISDDSKIGFSSANYSIIENTSAQSASLTVVRRGDTSGTASVDFLTADGSATAGVDYDARQETLVFVPGEVSKTFSITIRDDVSVEGNETVNLILTNLTGKAEFDRSQSTLVLVDNDFGPGELSFSDFAYSVRENGTNAVITVRRRSGSTGVVSVRYATTGGTATPDIDYAFTQGILSFADGEFDKSFSIRIFNDSNVEGNETVDITLSNPSGGATISGPSTVALAIIETHVGPGSLDVSFNPGVGADGEVRSLQLTPEGRVVVGGAFSGIDAFALPGIARLEANGAVDLTFSAGTRPDGEVSAVWLQSDGKMAIGGAFQNVSSPIVSSLNRGRVARLNANGTIDTTMNLSAGENGEVLALTVQQKDRKIVVAGTFTSPSRGVARLNVNGSLDVSFDPQTAANRPVRALALQSDDKILIGGDFTSFSGVARGSFARLARNGLLDIDFATGPRAGGSVYAIVVQPDGRILMAGDLTLTTNAGVLGVVRLESNGDLDMSWVPPSVLGPAGLTGGLVRAIALQKNGRIFIAGGFTNVAGVARNRVARLNSDGSLDTSLDPGLGPDDVVNSMVVQADGKIIIGGNFDNVSGFPRRKIARINGDPEIVPIEITAVTRDADGTVRLTFTSRAGYSYDLETSEDLKSWFLAGGATATGVTTELSDASGQGLRQRFYRVRLVGP
ncbi:MAG: Calx-beta domain-containing protein, partial [Verrucomicrobiota bacterium]